MQEADQSVPVTGDVSRRGVISRALWTGLAAVPVVSFLSSESRAYTGPQSPLDANDIEAFRDIKKHENAHVAFIVSLLGSKARPKPTFKNLNPTTFTQFVTMSRMFEATGSAAYLGALPSISSKANVATAGSLALVEARQAGFLDVFAGKDVTTQSATDTYSNFEIPLTIAQVVERVSPFLVSLNGGPPASFTPGDDVSIFNFALILEYLEQTFYNMNTEKFVGHD